MNATLRTKTRREFVRDVTLAGVGTVCYRLDGRAAAVSGTSRQSIPFGADWRFSREPFDIPADLPQSAPAFDDHAWPAVGIPHCFNDTDSYQNAPESKTYQGNFWYRKRFSLAESTRGKKIFLEFAGVNIGAAVYVNGRLKPGNTSVAQPGQVTHVGGFLPFVLDVTEDVHPGAENVLAVRVGNISDRVGYGEKVKPGSPDQPKNFFANPGFGNFLEFGMGFGGIVCPVTLYATDKVYIPANSFSPTQAWGTYVGVVSASEDTAKVRVQTNVRNDGDAPCEATLVTRVLDAAGQPVLTLRATRQVAPGTVALFDQTGDVAHPQLWYPNNSPYGKPYLYRVASEVQVGGVPVDAVENPLGIRMISWDDDYCYVNGKKHLLLGFGQRNLYPGLGSAIPAGLLWNDVRLIAECGGNCLRVGHVPSTVETVRACDAYGILILQNSGDNEWRLHGEPTLTYKKEYDRDMIIRFRNHPSIAVWESNNGIAREKDHYSPRSTAELVEQLDFIQPRIVGSRDWSDYWPTDRKIMIGYTNKFAKVKSSPSLNWEVYGALWGKGERSFGMARFDYPDEKVFADHYITDYLNNLDGRACGWIDWMLAETQSEPSVTLLNGMSRQKSLGSCAMDGNRLPKLTYEILKKALWIPFATRPGVALQSTWNLAGRQDVDAWSNCPKVELFLNGVSQGAQAPDAKARCTWAGIAWQAGVLKAVGLDAGGKPVCEDVRKTAGPPHHVELVVEPPVVRPDGVPFKIVANGSDAAIVTARVVDAAGTVCPDADNLLRFTVSGPGTYRGSYNFYVVPGKPVAFHAPGDPELQAEGGLMRAAVRSTFQPGTVQVTVSADGLGSGAASYEVAPLGS